MGLHTGDRVVHPQYGAGVVRGQCALTTNGATHDYYLIETPATHSTIYVDRLAADAGQLGAVMTTAHLPTLIALLASQPQPLPISSLERQALVKERLAGWQAMCLAEVIRDLTAFHHQNSIVLHQDDHDHLKKARLYLSVEWSLAANISIEAAQQQITDALDRGRLLVSAPD